MKQRFYLFQRGETFYLQDGSTGRQVSLQTKNRTEAERLLHARREAVASPSLNIALARTYLSAHDPKMLHRTWDDVLEEFCSRGQPQTQALRRRRLTPRVFKDIRKKKLVETTAEDFMAILKDSGVMLHSFLRCVHNLALGLGWLPWPVLASKLWPEPRFKAKRGITLDEHQQILAAERNEERRLYYELLWETGASQTDAALLKAENIDWSRKTLSYERKKTGSLACLSIGPKLESILRALPTSGLLFPHVGATNENARSAEFWRRCKLLGIVGVSLHSYRYAWAERAKECGYPERFAQEALGHNSKAVHRAYAREGRVVLPSLETFSQKMRKQTVVPVDFRAPQASAPQKPTSSPVAQGS